MGEPLRRLAAVLSRVALRRQSSVVGALGDRFWSWSTCRPDVQWYGVPGSGCHYWTARFGQYWVGGGVYQAYAAAGWECGRLGPPVKPYQWLSEWSVYGQFFEGGVIFYSNGWETHYGDFGQTAGRMPESEPPADAEVPPDAPGAEPPPDAPSDTERPPVDECN